MASHSRPRRRQVYDESSRHFAPVRMNERLTFDFDQNDSFNDWNGGRGLYFRDPNGHLFELLTQL